jgi:hypothetical protein
MQQRELWHVDRMTRKWIWLCGQWEEMERVWKRHERQSEYSCIKSGAVGCVGRPVLGCVRRMRRRIRSGIGAQ